jgi:hypothetical protein
MGMRILDESCSDPVSFSALIGKAEDERTRFSLAAFHPHDRSSPALF